MCKACMGKSSSQIRITKFSATDPIDTIMLKSTIQVFLVNSNFAQVKKSQNLSTKESCQFWVMINEGIEKCKKWSNIMSDKKIKYLTN